MYVNVNKMTSEEWLKILKDYENAYAKSYNIICRPILNENNVPELQQLVFDEQNRTSIAFWKDGTKTIVRCRVDEEFSQEGGLSALYMKKMFGSRGVIDKMLEGAKIVKPKVKKGKLRKSESYIDTCTVSQELFNLMSDTSEVE